MEWGNDKKKVGKRLGKKLSLKSDQSYYWYSKLKLPKVNAAIQSEKCSMLKLPKKLMMSLYLRLLKT